MIEIINDDCLWHLQFIPDNSFDAVVTDPPAGISFMGKDWDHHKGGAEAWITWLQSVMAECLRVLKPGGYALVWALPRTSHWTGMALERAGFEVRDCITHHFGSGFPKSLDVSKAIDKAAGAEREVVGQSERVTPRTGKNGNPGGVPGQMFRWGDEHFAWDDLPPQGRDYFNTGASKRGQITAPSTDAAKQWQGFGTALKPATEFWWLVRKPLSEKTVAANVLRWGTGALNIDGTRIGTDDNLNGGAYSKGKKSDGSWGTMHDFSGKEYLQPAGRFPANLVLSHSEDCENVGTKVVKGANGGGMNRDFRDGSTHIGVKRSKTETVGYADQDGTETVDAWECAEGCPVAELDRQSGFRPSSGREGKSGSGKPGMFVGSKRMATYADSGGASRFFYVAKASRRERGEGNTHPTVKPLKLMQYLIRMITPPGGTVLDPFAGSGTTGVAAVTEGFGFLGIEQEAEYAAIADARLTNAVLGI